jgi:ribonuclease D
MTLGGPPTFLWAWERPEDLRDVDSRETGVAVLTRTVTISRDRIAVQPRLQPLRVLPGTRILAVVRVEMESLNAAPGESRTSEIVRAIAGAALPQADGLQIDFDARVSDRPLYRRLLTDVRAALPKTSTLSITAPGFLVP